MTTLDMSIDGAAVERVPIRDQITKALQAVRSWASKWWNKAKVWGRTALTNTGQFMKAGALYVWGGAKWLGTKTLNVGKGTALFAGSLITTGATGVAWAVKGLFAAATGSIMLLTVAGVLLIVGLGLLFLYPVSKVSDLWSNHVYANLLWLAKHRDQDRKSFVSDYRLAREQRLLAQLDQLTRDQDTIVVAAPRWDLAEETRRLNARYLAVWGDEDPDEEDYELSPEEAKMRHDMVLLWDSVFENEGTYPREFDYSDVPESLRIRCYMRSIGDAKVDASWEDVSFWTGRIEAYQRASRMSDAQHVKREWGLVNKRYKDEPGMRINEVKLGFDSEVQCQHDVAARTVKA
jgi:hypothetical protein